MSRLKKLLLTVSLIFLPLTCFLIYREVTRTKEGTVIEQSVSAEVSTNESEQLSSIVVDIAGAVKFPGVYSFETEPRVGEVVAKAGGFSLTADKIWSAKNINLAKKVSNEQKIYIPFEWENVLTSNVSLSPLNLDDKTITKPVGSETTASPPATMKVNINSATESEIDSLPGIGAIYTQKIISSRPYANLTELQAKTGLSASVVEKLKDLITF